MPGCLQDGASTPLAWSVPRQTRRPRQQHRCPDIQLQQPHSNAGPQSLQIQAKQQLHCLVPKRGSFTTQTPVLTLREASSSSASTCSRGNHHDVGQPHDDEQARSNSTTSRSSSFNTSAVATSAVAALNCQHSTQPGTRQQEDPQEYSHADSPSTAPTQLLMVTTALMM